MGGGEGTNNGDSTGEGVHCLKSEAVNNGFEIRIGNDNGEPGSQPQECFRTYKRRKHTMSSSKSKGQDNERGFLEAASKLTDEATKESPGCPQNQAALNGSNDSSHKQCRNFVLERICQSLNDEKGGIWRCIQDALMMTIKESDPCEKDRHTSLQAGLMPNGTLCTDKGQVDVTSNEPLGESHRPVTEKCKHAFLNILCSEKFTLMCKLLCENFLEKKADNLLCLNLINMRMKNGVYERLPLLFCIDIQRVWKKLQRIGFELMSIGKSVSEVTLTCFNEQFGASKSEKFCTCRRCGGKADGRDCLVCDSCEEMFHVSCIEPAIKEILPKSWYCASCTAVGMESPHENCVVCERLDAPRNLCSEAGIEKNCTTENMFSEFEETSNCTRDDFRQPTVWGKSLCVCKACGSKVENGEKVKICENGYCPYRYYHMRCLTNNLLKSYGPRWYCPSCLCRACFLDRDDNQIILCDGCDNAYHMYCMNPPLTSVPKGKWFCRQCDVKIKQIHRVRRAYEKQENVMKMKAEVGKRAWENLEKKLDQKCEQESDNGRERMNMLLTAAFGENLDSV